MRRYIAIAVGLGLLLVVLTVTNAGPALAQGALKPISALIVNDSANPVPVTVIAAPAQTRVICTVGLGRISLGGSFAHGQFGVSDSSFVCSGGVTSIDVSRIVFTPDIGGSFGAATGVVNYRVTVTHGAGGTGPPPEPSRTEILAVLTDGAPDGAVIQPFRFDSASGGRFSNLITGSSGLAGVDVALSGSLVLIGTPAQ